MWMHEAAQGPIGLDHALHRLHLIADSAQTRTDCVRRLCVHHERAGSSASLASLGYSPMGMPRASDHHAQPAKLDIAVSGAAGASCSRVKASYRARDCTIVRRQTAHLGGSAHARLLSILDAEILWRRCCSETDDRTPLNDESPSQSRKPRSKQEEFTMATSAKRTLQPMRDAHVTTRDPAEDIRSRNVVDAAGKDIGEIEALLIDDQEEKVRFLRVASGGFLGMGQSKVLIPVEAISKIDRDVVHLDQTHERIAGAPNYDPDLVDDPYYEGLYRYYGYPPFWGAGYIYPPYPYYPPTQRPASSARTAHDSSSTGVK
jgi:sporulation protein YlmC with PRC-barrel domain